jgi:hypothetical protein
MQTKSPISPAKTAWWSTWTAPDRPTRARLNFALQELTTDVGAA